MNETSKTEGSSPNFCQDPSAEIVLYDQQGDDDTSKTLLAIQIPLLSASVREGTLYLRAGVAIGAGVYTTIVQSKVIDNLERHTNWPLCSNSMLQLHFCSLYTIRHQCYINEDRKFGEKMNQLCLKFPIKASKHIF